MGPNYRPPNSSHFRNLKCLKIAKVVSQKKFKKRKEKEKKREIMKEIGEEGKERKGGREGEWREDKNHSGNMLADKNTLLRKEGRMHKKMHKLCAG